MKHGSVPSTGLWTTRSFEHVTTPISLLIVDDDSAGAEALSAALAIKGFRTAVANEGCAAFRLPAGLTPHVVILDLEMPVCDGFAVAEAMRRSGQFSCVPIIAHTSLEEADVIERGMAVQIDAFCRKGMPIDALLRLIAHMTSASSP
jgi:CheY-like chemotaxis protein